MIMGNSKTMAVNNCDEDGIKEESVLLHKEAHAKMTQCGQNGRLNAHHHGTIPFVRER